MSQPKVGGGGGGGGTAMYGLCMLCMGYIAQFRSLHLPFLERPAPGGGGY